MKRSTRPLKKHRPFYEAFDAHARRRLEKKHHSFYEVVNAHARRRLKRTSARSSQISSFRFQFTRKCALFIGNCVSVNSF